MVTPKMSTSRINTPLDARRKMIELLNQQLADTFDLYGQTIQLHWQAKDKN